MDKIVEYIAAFFAGPNKECSDLEMLELLPCNAIYLGERVNFRGKVFERVEPTANHPYHFVCEVEDIYAGNAIYWDANEEKMVNTICHFYFKEDGFSPRSGVLTVSRKGSGWNFRTNSVFDADSDTDEKTTAYEEVPPSVSYQDYENLWTEFIDEIKKMVWEDFGCIGKQKIHCFGTIKDYGLDFGHRRLPNNGAYELEREFCYKIQSALEKAKFLEDYFTYCTLSGRAADMELVNWWFDELCKS